jgi:hypothetical protein
VEKVGREEDFAGRHGNLLSTMSYVAGHPNASEVPQSDLLAEWVKSQLLCEKLDWQAGQRQNGFKVHTRGFAH